MKAGLYHKYYKLGLEHYINKHYLKLHKPNVIIDIFYIGLIATIIAIALLFS